jgi:hypothetical protein
MATFQSSGSDITGSFLDAPPDLDIDGITRSVFKTFSVIEPWYQGEK